MKYNDKRYRKYSVNLGIRRMINERLIAEIMHIEEHQIINGLDTPSPKRVREPLNFYPVATKRHERLKATK